MYEIHSTHPDEQYTARCTVYIQMYNTHRDASTETGVHYRSRRRTQPHEQYKVRCTLHKHMCDTHPDA